MDEEEKRVAEIYRKSYEYGEAYEYGLRAGLAARDAEVARLREALEAARAWISPEVEEFSYGDVAVTDPRDFHPDPDCSTDEERAAWRVACEQAERGETVLIPGGYWLEADTPEAAKKAAKDAVKSGAPAASTYGTRVHVSRQGWGLGTSTFRNPDAKALLDTIDAALADPTKVDG